MNVVGLTNVVKLAKFHMFNVCTKIKNCSILLCLVMNVLRVSRVIVSVLAHQIDKNIQGRLTWTAGVHSSMNATLVWDRDLHHIVTSVQVYVHFVLN